MSAPSACSAELPDVPVLVCSNPALINFVSSGKVHIKPLGCDQDTYSVLLQCWQFAAEDRSVSAVSPVATRCHPLCAWPMSTAAPAPCELCQPWTRGGLRAQREQASTQRTAAMAGAVGPLFCFSPSCCFARAIVSTPPQANLFLSQRIFCVQNGGPRRSCRSQQRRRRTLARVGGHTGWCDRRVVAAG